MAGLLLGCGNGTEPSGPTRTYRMGFSPIPPRPDLVFQNLEMWSQRADAAILHVSMPYADLLAGMTPTAIIDRDIRPVVQYHRGKGQAVVVTLDLTDGLNRAAEAPDLVRLGRSLSEAVVQQRVREFALAISREITPAWLGLAAETNLIRAVAPASLYQAVRTTANATAAALRSDNTGAQLFVSVQVEVAWGWVAGTPGYVGIGPDLQDFPFAELIGLSSYPYFVYADPDLLPADYYSRIRAEAGKPVIVVEGGWTSRNVSTVGSSEEIQRRYIARHAALLDRAGALLVVQLTFADFDIASFPPPVPDNLGPFAYIGLVKSNLDPKPALQVWDSVFQIPRK
jgi:hypothetical protein